MGAYLSQPKTDKVSTDELSELLTVGASSMQGWRNSQEDAHNSILNYDDNNTSFFAVYDGHGGAEVATYCADRMPDFLKHLDSYKNSNFEGALKQAFLEFDRSLLEPQVVEILKILAGEKNMVDDSDAMEYEEDEEDLVELHEESNLPLNELLEKYKGHPAMPVVNKLRAEAGGSSSGAGSSAKPQSPYLRGRRTAAIVAQATNKALMDPDSKPQGSSTSAAALAACNMDAHPSSSRSNNRIAPIEDATVSSSSSSSSAEKVHNHISSETNTNNSITEADGLNINGALATSTSLSATTTSPKLNATAQPDSSDISKQCARENGNVTSSEAKAIITSSSMKPTLGDATVSGSNDCETSAVAVAAKQNGSVGSSTACTGSGGSAKADVAAAAISSTTSKVASLPDLSGAIDDDSTDDDAEFRLENFPHESAELVRPSEDSTDDDEEDGDDADSEPDTDEFDEDGDEEDDDDDDEEEVDDVETVLANQQFCSNMIEEPGKDSGCTAVVALLHGRDLYVANAGDSRCVVSRNGKAIDMSLDHKPEDDEESARILKAGGRVTMDGRVNGGLNLSRAIGDHAYKMNTELPLEEQMISARPDIKKLIITPEDEFMVLACDGIWNFMSSDEVVEFVGSRLKQGSKRLSEICEELFDHCLAPDTMGDGTGCDNMTAVIVRFQPKLLELPTHINPEETEAALLLKKEAAEKDSAAVERKTQKRTASPSEEQEEDNAEKSVAETANKTKRLKTEDDHIDNVDAVEEDGEVAVAPCSTTEKTIGENVVERNECDSGVVVSTAAIAAQSSNAASSSTCSITPTVSTA